MKKFRGFNLGKRFFTSFQSVTRPGRSQIGYSTFNFPVQTQNPRFRSKNSGTGYIQLGRVGRKRVGVPEGHLAVYVGDEGRRVLVPVIYFNHPLFGELLKETEEVYGFNHSGGITIPCRISEFEKVQMRIAGWDHYRREQYRRYWL